MTNRILVVEDQEYNLQIPRDLLGHAGFELIEAKDGEEGVRKAVAERPDLILMDIQLPLLDGYQATRRIKADPALRAIRSSSSLLMPWAVMRPRRVKPAAMPMYPSPIARASCWRRSESFWRSVRLVLILSWLALTVFGPMH